MFKKKYSLLKYFGKSKKHRHSRKILRKKCKSNNHCKRYNKSKRNMRGGRPGAETSPVF